jgi:hypothetical protein
MIGSSRQMSGADQPSAQTQADTQLHGSPLQQNGKNSQKNKLEQKN